jgi:uncharacterized membrane protein
MATRRTVIEGWIVVVVTVIIAGIFIFASKPYDAPAPGFGNPTTYPHAVATHHA